MFKFRIRDPESRRDIGPKEAVTDLERGEASQFKSRERRIQYVVKPGNEKKASPKLPYFEGRHKKIHLQAQSNAAEIGIGKRFVEPLLPPWQPKIISHRSVKEIDFVAYYFFLIVMGYTVCYKETFSQS